eukprot:scaffold18269_cov71-Phaeocystis_antarctica.AAC.13
MDSGARRCTFDKRSSRSGRTYPQRFTASSTSTSAEPAHILLSRDHACVGPAVPPPAVTETPITDTRRSPPLRRTRRATRSHALEFAEGSAARATSSAFGQCRPADSYVEAGSGGSTTASPMSTTREDRPGGTTNGVSGQDICSTARHEPFISSRRRFDVWRALFWQRSPQLFVWVLCPTSPRCMGSLPVGYCVRAVRPLVEVTAAMVQGSRRKRERGEWAAATKTISQNTKKMEGDIVRETVVLVPNFGRPLAKQMRCESHDRAGGRAVATRRCFGCIFWLAQA